MDVKGQRLSFLCTTFDDKNENKSIQIIRNHHLNYSISVVVPNESSIPADVLDNVESSSYFVIEDLGLEDFVQFNFIEAFVRRGSLTLMSLTTRVDADFCFCLLPNGLLVLNIPKEDYESFGLEGQHSNFFQKNKFKYVIQFDLKDPKLVPSSKKYLRLVNTLHNCSQRFKAVISWIPPNEDISTESIRSYFINRNLKCKIGKPLRSRNILQDFRTPLIDPERPDASFDGCGPEAFYEWLGAISCGCSFADCQNYENTMTYPETYTTHRNCYVYTIRGFYSSAAIETFISRLRTWASESDKGIPWLSVTVHGFMDSPISWHSSEHGFDVCGDNNHTTVIFPGNPNLWSFLTHHSKETSF